MSRIRTRRPERKSNYITPEGAARLRDELNHLWQEERPKVTQEVAEAAAQGDRSENASYIYGKKKLREIDSRIRYLAKRLDKLVVVNEAPKDLSRIYFGAWVELEDEDDTCRVLRVVGPDETDAERGWISLDSPLGKALLGKQQGDEVAFRAPNGEREYFVLRVAYEPI